MTQQLEKEACQFQGRSPSCVIDGLQRKLLIPDEAWEEAHQICCGATRSRLLPSRPQKTVAGASVYAACREFNVPVSIRDVATAVGEDRVELGRSYKVLLGRIGMTPPPPNLTRFALKVASVLGVSPGATALALRIEREAINGGVENRMPMTIAAASVYLSCLSTGEVVTQSDVADAAGVSVVSVRECSRAMRGLVSLS